MTGLEGMTMRLQNIGYTGKLYKFFKEENHAIDFCKGYVYINTLSAYRGYENPEQGDKKEGVWSHEITSLTTEPSKKDEYKAYEQFGIFLGGSGTTIGSIKIEQSIPDAYAICTTKEYKPNIFEKDFGSHCVEISNARKFFTRVSRSILLEKNGKSMSGFYSNVEYRKRNGINLDTPKHIGLIKESNHEWQSEFRFLWVPDDPSEKISAFKIECKNIRTLCKIIY
ncbi:hypothetical protein QK324_21625 [Serratia ureilytica]|uniref:hypothetical protein n=1 Tax=Serratia ureilytica TaxID=300181 RepID=UPI00249BB7F2|nr:hypothetical protein [Serratia ureilytica]MDI3200618.1 hypothetical protein [Serratia ureilytica]